MASSFAELLQAQGVDPSVAEAAQAARAQSFEDMVRELGNPAADAASRLSSIQRQYNLGTAEVERAGEREREGIDESMEGRGILDSGHRNEEQAKQAEDQTARYAQLDVAAADDISAIDRDLQRQAAATRADRVLQEEQNRMQQDQLNRALGIAREEADDTFSRLRDYGWSG